MKKTLCTLLLCATSLAGLVGCGGSSRKVEIKKDGQKLYFRLSKDADIMYNNIFFYRKEHGLTLCEDQERAAVLIAASAKDGDPTNRIEDSDMKDFYKQVLQEIEARYGGRIPGVNGVSADGISKLEP